jgi:hypothetical protein
MKFSDGVQDAARSAPADTAAPEAAADDGDEGQARLEAPKTPRAPEPRRAPEPLQDIQDIIDKLAVVTQQLRAPHHGPGRVPGPTT